MPVDVACPACKATYKVPENILGKNLKCKGCQTSFVATAGVPASAFADLGKVSTGRGASSPALGTGPKRGRGLAVALLGVVVFALVGGLAFGAYYLLKSGAGGDWQEFASKEGGFTVLVPVAPTAGKAADAKIGAELREFVAKPAKSPATYTVQFADLPEKPINDYLFYAFLKNTALASKPDSKLASEQDITLGSYTGRQIALDLPEDQRLTRRMFVVENRVYLVSAQHPTAEASDVDRFLDSFKITNPPPAGPKPTVTWPPPTTPQVAVGPKPTFPDIKIEPLFPPKGKGTPPPPPDKTMPPDKGKNPPPVVGNFPITADEQGILDELNKLRATEPAPALRPHKPLFEMARAEAAALVNKNPIQRNNDTGYRNFFRFTVPVAGVVTPQLLITGLADDKRTKRELVDNEFTDVGIGFAKNAEGVGFYVIILAGNPR